MNTNISKEYYVRVLCVGILSLILISIVLFAVLKTAQIIFYESVGITYKKLLTSQSLWISYYRPKGWG